MNNIYLIEDHNEALGIWKQKNLKGLDLVHLDAHIDFGFHPAEPVEKIVNQAKTLKELKKGLEHSLAFMQYEKDFNKQTHIGNYIYPAMEEGMVENFYWVVPGGQKEFKASLKSIKNILLDLTKDSLKKITTKRSPGVISTKLLGRDLVVCTLERLPVLRQNVLLDVDTDFLVIDSLLNANLTAKIGKRRPWVLPQDLAGLLKKRIRNPRVITIAYSVNGGWTPLKYKYLADEIAYNFAPEKFKKRFEINSQAAKYFNLFASTGKKKYYQKAVKSNPTYRVWDNNYGPLYLSLRKFSLAKREFLKILRADPKNPAPLLGLGDISLERKDYIKAKKYFSSVLSLANNRLFHKVKRESLLGLAKAEFNLKDFNKAKKLLSRYQTLQPLQPQSYYLLGRISEKEKEFERSVTLYKDAQSLGFGDIELIWRLLQVSRHLKEKKDVMKYIRVKYKGFKKDFTKEKNRNFKKGKKNKGLRKVEKRIAGIEKMLQSKTW